MFSEYYLAYLKKEECYFFSAALKSLEHVALARTLEKDKSLWEFFVSEENEDTFIKFLKYFQKQKIVIDFEKCENRLLDPETEV